MFERKELSLLDTAKSYVVDVWVVFTELDEGKLDKPRSPFWRLLRPGFRHVEVWKQLGPNVWIQLATAVEHIHMDVHTKPPWEAFDEQFKPTAVRVQRTVRVGKWRHRFFVGPITCVELTKAFLGIGDFFVRTPRQLYNHLRTQ